MCTRVNGCTIVVTPSALTIVGAACYMNFIGCVNMANGGVDGIGRSYLELEERGMMDLSGISMRGFLMLH